MISINITTLGWDTNTNKEIFVPMPDVKVEIDSKQQISDKNGNVKYRIAPNNYTINITQFQFPITFSVEAFPI